MRLPNAAARIQPVANPRDRARFHAGGCLGAARARRRGRLRTAARDGHRRSIRPTRCRLPARAVVATARAASAGLVRPRHGSRARRSVGRASLPIPGTNETSLAGRLPDDLRGTADDVHMGSVPFAPLYRTDDEFAAEVSNRTVHGVLHLAWVDKGGDRYQGQMGVYVKPRGRFGDAYMLDQAVPLLDRLPGADAAVRARLGAPPAVSSGASQVSAARRPAEPVLVGHLLDRVPVLGDEAAHVLDVVGFTRHRQAPRRSRLRCRPDRGRSLCERRSSTSPPRRARGRGWRSRPAARRGRR